MIRACKKNRYSPYALRRIYGTSHVLLLCHTPIEYATIGLMEIITKYNLVHDWNRFITEIDEHRTAYWYWFMNVSNPESHEMPFTEAFLMQGACMIACAEIKKFPEYRSSAWFRNLATT